MAAVATTNFADRLAEAVERKRSQLVVGLDPRPDLLPVELKGDAHLGREQAAEACGRFCRGLVDAVAPYVVAVKPQVAFFEALGADGIRVFEDICAYARSTSDCQSRRIAPYSTRSPENSVRSCGSQTMSISRVIRRSISAAGQILWTRSTSAPSRAWMTSAQGA